MKTCRLFIAAALFMLSQVSFAQNLHYEGSTVTVVDPGANVATTPVIADESICGERFTETVVLDQFPANRRNLRYVDTFQALALARLAKEHDADFIIATQTGVCTRDGCFAVTVTGYPARYENFRKPTQEDMNLLWKARAPGYGPMFGQGGDAYTSMGRSYYAGLIEVPRFDAGPGFQQMIDLTFVPTDDMALEFTYAAGYRFTNSFFLGAGTGLAYSWWQENAYVPLFVNPMFYIGRRRVAPAIGLRLGANFSIIDDCVGAPVSALVDLRPGIRVHTDSGKDINISLSLGTRPDVWNTEEGSREVGTYFEGGLSVGFSF